MTFKKSMISIAAAAVLAAGLTGCGSSDSTTAATTTTDATSSVTAVDGYIINATATAVYFDDNNVSVAEPMTSTLHTTNSVDSTLDTVGAADYTMTDDTNKSRVRYFTLSNKVLSVSGAVTTPATFIDDGSVAGKYDVNDTLFATRFPSLTLYAPAGSAVVTPVTSLVVQQLGGIAQFTPANMGADVNTTDIAQAMDIVAAKLGLTAATIRDIDPTDSIATYPEYALINTMLAQVIADGKVAAFTTALVAENNATSATTFTQTLTKLETAATTAALTTNVFTNVIADVTALGETAYVAAISTLNLDDTMKNGGSAVYGTASTTAIANVTGITLDSDDVFLQVNAGDKITSTATDGAKDVAITFAAPDANASGTVDLLVQLSGGTTAESNTTSNSSEITIKVSGLDLTTTDAGVVTLDVNSTNTKYTYMYQESNSTGAYFTSQTDVNGSSAGIADFATATSDTETTLDIQALINDVEGNATGTFASASFDFSNIMGVKIILVDNGNLQKVATVNSNTVKQVWGSTTVSSIVNPSGLSGNGYTVINLAKADSRGATTILNAANTITGIAGVAFGGTIANGTREGDVNATATQAVLLGETVMVNIDTNTSTAAADYNVSIAVTDGSELNTTVAGTVTDTNVSGFVTFASAQDSSLDGTNGQMNVVNLTLDTYPSVTSGATGHPQSVVTFETTDEFGKSTTGGDYNVTFSLNRAPVITNNADINNSSDIGVQSEETNSSIQFMTAADADNDALTYAITSATAIGASINSVLVSCGDANATGANIHALAASAVDLTAGATTEICLALGASAFDTNATYVGMLQVNVLSDGNISVTATDGNTTADTQVTGDINLTITAKDQYGLSATTTDNVILEIK